MTMMRRKPSARREVLAALTRAKLHHLYWEVGLSSMQIAARFGVSGPTIHTRLHQEGIPLRAKRGGRTW